MHRDRTALLDEMIELSMEELLSGNQWRRQGLIRLMAERWPEEQALSLVYAVTSATQAIEDQFGKAAAEDPAVGAGFRLAALAAADIHAVQSMGQMPALAEDLLHFWRRADARPAAD